MAGGQEGGEGRGPVVPAAGPRPRRPPPGGPHRWSRRGAVAAAAKCGAGEGNRRRRELGLQDLGASTTTGTRTSGLGLQDFMDLSRLQVTRRTPCKG